MKKVRGKKRKLQMIEQRLAEATSSFPETFYNHKYVWKLPASQDFVEGLKRKERAAITRFLESCAASLIERKPNEAFKVAILLFPQNMWYSQIIVFENIEVQHDFITDHVVTDHWIELKDGVIKQFSDGTQNLFLYVER